MNDEMDRYSTLAMSAVWTPDWKIRRWVEIELAAAAAQGAPDAAINEMAAVEPPQVSRVQEEELKTKHDVIAFLNVWRRDMGPLGRAWTHRGLTSSDVVDTANALRMRASTDIIRTSVINLLKLVGNQAIEHRNTVRVGRTHGQTAEVTTWGWRLAEFTYALDRALERLLSLSSNWSVGKLSGPVGDYKRVSHTVERKVMWLLGLQAPRAASQVVMRDAYVDYVFALSQIATVVESIALEVRLSSRTETGEVAEGFGRQQRGSSAMPHKRNPIKAEQLTGLARLVRAQVEPVAAGVALHHERDISHSSVERIALRTASLVTDYMLSTCFQMMFDLQVFPEIMRERAVTSPELMSAMIKDHLTSHGVDPETAYEVVFQGFTDWKSGAYRDLSNSLSASWIGMEVNGQVDGSWRPDFTELTGRMDRPEELLGNTDHAYEHIKTVIEPPY